MLSSYRQLKFSYFQIRCCVLEAKLQNVWGQHDLSILTYRPLHRTIATQRPRKTKPHLHGLALWSGNVLVTMTHSEVPTGHPQHPGASTEEGSGWHTRGSSAGHPQFPSASTEEGCGWPKSPLAHVSRG